MMRRGVAPDRVSGIMALTVLASLGVNLRRKMGGKKQIRVDCCAGITLVIGSLKNKELDFQS